MWTCPKCNHKFFNRNQSHSCGPYTVANFLKDKPQVVKKLFKDFISACKTIGAFDLHPVKTRVALLTRMRFASVNKLGKDYLDGHLVLVEECDEPELFYKIDNLNDRFFVHHFRITHKQEISRLKPFMKRAYRVGMREHVKQKGRSK